MKYQNLVNNDSHVILTAWRKHSACRVSCVISVTFIDLGPGRSEE